MFILREYEQTVGQKSLGTVLSEGFEKVLESVEKPGRRKSRSRREAKEKLAKENSNVEMVSFDTNLKGVVKANLTFFERLSRSKTNLFLSCDTLNGEIEINFLP